MSDKPSFIKDLSLPAIAAPLFLISGPKLVIECCKNGIVGTFPALNQRTSEGFEEWLVEIKSELQKFEEETGKKAAPFGVNLIVHPTNPRLEADIKLCVKHKVPVIITSLGDGCGCYSHTGRDIASALQMGADMAYMGTRFINTDEAKAPEEYKNMIINAGASDVTYTAAISGVHANFLGASLKAAGITEEDLKKDKKIDFGKELDTEAKAWKRQKRERIELPDGDFLDLDWSFSTIQTQKAVILIHGLEGNAQRAYIAGSAKVFNANGYDACAINLRTCSGEMNRLFRSYHSGATEDLACEDRDHPVEIKAAMAVSVPCDLHSSCKELLSILAISALIASCGEKKEEKKESFEMNRAKTEKKAEVASEGVPVDMDNDGVGPFSDITFADDIDTELAAAGEAKFSAICTACHMAEQRMIGPALKGVYERRSPAWVMNMISERRPYC
ncbi:putative esterase YheT [Nymphon striatum]|nr:putative esterase YheT [Nymphon striatum]